MQSSQSVRLQLTLVQTEASSVACCLLTQLSVFLRMHFPLIHSIFSLFLDWRLVFAAPSFVHITTRPDHPRSHWLHRYEGLCPVHWRAHTSRATQVSGCFGWRNITRRSLKAPWEMKKTIKTKTTLLQHPRSQISKTHEYRASFSETSLLSTEESLQYVAF